ncbi:MAG: acyl--CoA ligase [Erysipelotrichaceae bacterium]|jgi:fatty-acyl-CoA synthase|nr:acyl--CoA ligase [Erysipelotrichaceae bacterium]
MDFRDNATKGEPGFFLFEDIYRAEEEKKDVVGVWFDGASFTYAEIEKSVDFYADFLSKHGVSKGDHVALLGVNCYNWLIAFYAIIRVGAVAVLLNYMARHSTLVELIKSTDCKFLCFGKYSALTKEEGELKDLLSKTGIPKKSAFSIQHEDLDFKEALSKGEIEPFASPFPREEDSKRTSLIVFTTGTTARPKPAMLSQYGMMNIIYLSLSRLDPIFPQKFMCLLPMFHCFGLLVVNAYLAFRRSVYLNTLMDKLKVYKEFLRNRCGDYASVSIVFDNLAKAPFWWFHRARFVKHCIVGGGFTSRRELRFLERKYGKGKFLNGYGQTECSPLISLVYPDAPRAKQLSTVGTPIKGIELAFMDPQTKELLPKGQKGEILVRGYNVFNGYYKTEPKDQPIDENGYLHTGDLGYLDEDGYLVLDGRIKDIIIRKGENISPKEIEEELRKFPEFRAARVLGFPSVDEGEYIMACVEVNKIMPHFFEKKYLDAMRKNLPSIKIPAHIVYMRKFPLTPSGKLDEPALREICMNRMAKFFNEEVLARKTRKLMEESSKKRR